MNNKKNIFLLGLVSFLNDLSSEMIAPILPLFISSLGGGGISIGLIGGLRDSVASLLNVLSGWWSDRTGQRKVFVFSGYFISSVFKLLLFFSKTWPQVLIFAGLERVGKGLRSAPRDAIIADSLPDAKGKGFGIHRAFDTAGAIAGSVAALFLFWFFGLDFKLIILLAALTAFASLAPLLFVREIKTASRNIPLKLGLKNLPPSLRFFIVIAGIFAMANFSYMFFILRAQEFFPNKLAIAVPILLYILFNIFYALLAVPFGVLSDRIGKRKLIIFGYLLFAITCFGFIFARDILTFIILFILYGIVNAIIDGNQRAYVADLSDGGLKATALGTYHTVIGLAALPASLIAGFLWQSVAPTAAFLYGSVLSMAAVILFISFRER